MKKDVLIAAFMLFAGLCSAQAYVINSSETNNTQIRIFYGDTLFDNATNIMFIADIHPTNQTYQLNYGEAYTDNLSGNVARAPQFPTFPRTEVSLTYGNCYNLTDNLLMDYCLQAPQNQPVLNYSNSTFNLTVWAPEFPRISEQYEIQEGETLPLPISYDAEVTCKAIARTDSEIKLYYNETILNNVTNTTYHCKAFPDLSELKDLKLKIGETYQNTKYDIKAYCGETLDINRTLFIGEEYVNPALNLTCKVDDNLNRFIAYYQLNASNLTSTNATCVQNTTVSRNDTTICYSTYASANCTNLISVPANTTSGTIAVCLDTADQFCTYEELKVGDIAGCVRRVTATSVQQANSSEINYKQCRADLQQYANGEKIRTEIKGDINNNLTWLLGGLFFVLIAVALGIYLSRSRRLPSLQKEASDEKVRQMVKNEIGQMAAEFSKKE